MPVVHHLVDVGDKLLVRAIIGYHLYRIQRYASRENYYPPFSSQWLTTGGMYGCSLEKVRSSLNLTWNLLGLLVHDTPYTMHFIPNSVQAYESHVPLCDLIMKTDIYAENLPRNLNSWGVDYYFWTIHNLFPPSVLWRRYTISFCTSVMEDIKWSIANALVRV